MRKAIIGIIVMIILSMSSYAAMDCSIMDVSACTGGDKEIIFTISDLADGGSHVLPAGNPGAFPKAVCCEGVAGLTAYAQGTAPASFQHLVGYFADGHFNRTGTLEIFKYGLWLDAPTDIRCGYSSANCAGYDTCVFSISEDSSGFSHVSGCDSSEHPFDLNYCCGAGEASCHITDIYWGLYNEETEEIEPLVGTGPIGGGMPVFLIVETSGCPANTGVTFTIYQEGDIFKDDPFTETELGYFEEEHLGEEYKNIAIAVWEKAGYNKDGTEGPEDGEFTFKVRLYKAGTPPMEVTGESPKVKVEKDGCGMTLDDLEDYFVCTAPDTPPGCCGETLPAKCSSGPGELCEGGYCIDTDCDGVPDCLDAYIATVADPSTVDRCSGVEAGTAGCVPAMNCLELTWSECKNCEAGQPCERDGGFSAGTMFMERCEGMAEADCKCKWEGGVAPPGCTDDVLNQWDNRFKECIEEEEFPVFDGFNVVAVLLVLSIYYAIVIVRKKK